MVNSERAPAPPVPVSSVNTAVMSPVTVAAAAAPAARSQSHAACPSHTAAPQSLAACPSRTSVPQSHATCPKVNGASQQHTPAKKTPRDFIFGKVIGEGSFSTVYIAKDIHNRKELAIKVCDKRHILREHKEEYIKREKDVLNMVSNSGAPFFVKLFATFQDATRLYFVLTYAKHGELLPHINRVGSFDMASSRFYAAEILVALEHLKRLNIVHRDLKPENILLDENMHILITDFGSSKIMTDHNDTNVFGADEDDRSRARKNSFVGTAQYVSPELLTAKTASASSDLWALGCIIYQMVYGLPPFRSGSEFLIFKQIMNLNYEFPDGFCPVAKDLIEKLLVLEPSQRLGASDEVGYPSIRQHNFFQGIEFDTLQNQTPPLIYPYHSSTSDNHDLRSQYRVPDNLEPGLDDKQMTRLLGLELHESPKKQSLLTGLSADEVSRRLKQQEATNQFHRFVDGNLILKQGLVDKKKGLFARRRMLLLTTGPHLYYVDPIQMQLKGKIPWSNELSVEGKSFKAFHVHTPNRIYYLEDPEYLANEWCDAINELQQQHQT
ncbi:3-phosphoinositide-dependent protein kinase 1 isoform X7 [Nilaparvata lugens]|uniref:3-phosphoinositide-dependent protein kinase 1 isoform X7 n=1 Tax=Nilaparvata lugens TaxID=108931 RepID=UPI00193D0688|nr:3-phosphoinositide-dependent protein kinase 1 isoform X7 [Nilaparvata lugens]